MEKLSLGNAVSRPVWRCLEQPTRFNESSLAETLIGGQAFRWFYEAKDNCWTGTWDGHVASLRLSSDAGLEARLDTPQTGIEDIRTYLATDRVSQWIEKLPCNADPVLDELRERWSGLSILRQSPDEALLAFICSSNKQILQIRAMLHTLSLRCGSPIKGTVFNRLPTWEELSQVDEPELRQCALGYRAAHVWNTASFLKANTGYLESVKNLPTDQARIALQALPGVGPKVADCVLLFGYGRADAFPVDTWIEKILIEKYPPLSTWTRQQIATFARIHFGEASGLAQQWFFAEARSAGSRKKGRTDWPAL